ncbi:hypothetical protein BRADI_3g36620v3, partial [Brachypodium distachyon]
SRLTSLILEPNRQQSTPRRRRRASARANRARIPHPQKRQRARSRARRGRAPSRGGWKWTPAWRRPTARRGDRRASAAAAALIRDADVGMEARVCARILPALPPPLCVPSWLLRPPRPILHRGLAAAPSSHRPCLLNFWTGAPTQCGMPLRARYKLPTGFLPAWDLSLEGSLHGLSSASRAPSSTPSPATCSRTCPFAIVVNLREALCRYRPQLDQVRQGSHLLPLTFGSNRQFASQLRRHLDSQGIMLPNLFSWMYTSISLSSDTHLSTITDAVMLLPHMSCRLLAPWFQIRATVAAWLTLQAYGACRQGSSAAGRVVDCRYQE